MLDLATGCRDVTNKSKSIPLFYLFVSILRFSFSFSIFIFTCFPFSIFHFHFLGRASSRPQKDLSFSFSLCWSRSRGRQWRPWAFSATRPPPPPGPTVPSRYPRSSIALSLALLGGTGNPSSCCALPRLGEKGEMRRDRAREEDTIRMLRGRLGWMGASLGAPPSSWGASPLVPTICAGISTSPWIPLAMMVLPSFSELLHNFFFF